jgi:hypothetical protein
MPCTGITEPIAGGSFLSWSSSLGDASDGVNLIELNLGGYVNARFSSGDSHFSSRDHRHEFSVLAGGKPQKSTSPSRLAAGFPAPEMPIV